MDQCELKNVDDITPTERGRSIMLYTADSLRNKLTTQVFEIGKYPPYYGSETREKVDRPRMTVVHPSALTTSLKKLVLLRSWTVILKSDNLTKFIDLLINEKITLIPEEMKKFKLEEWCSAITGGNILHRMHCTIERISAMINQIPTISTHLHLDSTSMYECVKGGQDFSIFYQPTLLYGQTLMAKKIQDKGKIEKQYALHLECNECTREILGFTFTLDIDPPEKFNNGFKICFADLTDQFVEPEINMNIPIDTDKVCLFLSVYYGQKMGIDLETVRGAIYADESISDLNSVTHISQKYSMTEMRYVVFDY